MIRIFHLLLCLLVAAAGFAQQWQPDILGDGYQSRRVDQGTDYSGPVVSTIIRKLAPDTVASQHAAVLYVHGFNDYFFQAEMGDRFTAKGYDFYAVDLRKYGRSLLPGQRRCEARDISEYFPDIDSALVAIQRTGIHRIALMGHSTGGLITACFMARNDRPDIKALLLNSPFLDWNLGWKEHIVPLVAFWGKFFPNTRISQGDSTGYGESLLRGAHGEWTFNTDWKTLHSPDVTAGWIRAIDRAQRSLRDGKARISVPILLMYSARAVGGSEHWTPVYDTGDAVLDPADIRRYGCMLGPNVTCLKVNGGLHDLILSRPAVRDPLYRYIFHWLTLHNF